MIYKSQGLRLHILHSRVLYTFFLVFLPIYFQEATTSQEFVITTDCWTHTAWKIMLGYLFLTEYIVSHMKWWHGTNTNQ